MNERPSPPVMSRRNLFRAAGAVLVLSALGFLVWGVFFVWNVAADASRRIDRGVIARVIASESPVYYDDGRTPLGVFFEETHRKYIPFEKIPKTFVKALVAAEDARFFDHHGFDPRAILRAMLVNIRAGKVVQGGSTLTQQTAKNIFQREKRSYVAKFKELVQAFLLERRYSKEEILEMYANQFFVTGFGKGLRIAAAYFFDKEAEDLDLVESAFIAGSVKGPNRYNPFVKRTDTEKEAARIRADERKNYVLANMLKLGFITRSEYEDAVKRSVPFKKGKITYGLNVVLDYVREQLESEYFRRILSEQGIDNIATSGIKIYTSVNREIQEGALESLRRHLEALDVQLSGYDPRLIAARRSDFYQLETRGRDGGLPFLARITHVERGTKAGSLVVSWDHGGGVIDYEGLKHVGEAWLRWKLGKWAVFGPAHMPGFLRNFREGDLVPVRFRKNGGASRGADLVLSTLPELEGAVVVLHRGMVKAMVGGFLDRFFNRAVDAKRQLGSIFKPIVYAAALQLKWDILDPLPNRREVYSYQGTVYCPRPDHKPKSDRVSLLWAGVKSENLATVWLLAHLTDRLSLPEFERVMRILGLDRREGEGYEAYKKRIRDRHGVVVGRRALMEAAFEQAKKEVEPDVIFSGDDDVLDDLRALHFRLPGARLNLPPDAARAVKAHDFTRLRDLDRAMSRAWNAVLSLLEKSDHPRFEETAGLRGLLRRFHVAHDGDKTHIVYGVKPVHPEAAALEPLTPALLSALSPLPQASEIRIDGVLPSRTIHLLQDRFRENYKRLLGRPRYGAETLYWIRDFRLLVNLSYVVYLARRMGMTSPLEPVLSFPLGPDAVSIGEAACVYHAFMDGRRYALPGGGESNKMIPLITRITDRNGETLWEYGSGGKKEVLSRRIRGFVSEILRKVFERGTARSAEGMVRLRIGREGNQQEMPVPSYGKTGTSNRNRNSSFVGFVPGYDEETGLPQVEQGYVIAAYVGFDDNRPMTSRRFTIYGSSGALPIWVDTANAVVNSAGFAPGLDPVELIFGSGESESPEGMHPVKVNSITGLPVSSDKASDVSGGDAVEILVRGARHIDAVGVQRVFEPCCEARP
ncbi:MAG: transglycosylase domain-containing protein [Deltaproteobacteria bacterium]|nr:transglycosylase domain-containing protein [Deltaproteobacteria bacterium]MBW1950291.1 transglycosylase domain-containing protein [Deltaproteobacteria bacterium]MBW2347823.1 transglycosylase domain-containing protein [Deltaproteobacteria bacterium]